MTANKESLGERIAWATIGLVTVGIAAPDRVVMIVRWITGG